MNAHIRLRCMRLKRTDTQEGWERKRVGARGREGGEGKSLISGAPAAAQLAP